MYSLSESPQKGHLVLYSTSLTCLKYTPLLARAYIKSGIYKNILIVATDATTKFTDWKDRSSCVLFGKLQVIASQAIGASPTAQAWVAAANATGACAGKMISPLSIAIGSAAIGVQGADSQLLAFAVKFYIPFVIFMGAVVYFGQALLG